MPPHFDRFCFDSYDFNPVSGKIELRYSMGGTEGSAQFLETLVLGKEQRSWATADLDALNRALFALHMIGGISYFKTCLPKKIEVRSGALTPEQAEFWKSVYEHGLGEFFYRNNIDFRGLINFPSDGVPMTIGEKREANPVPRVLVPIGGGKDSLVTVELLKKAGTDCTLFRMGSHPLIETLAKDSGVPLRSIERHLSPALFDLNAKGALNGHVPITAYLSCVSVVMAVLENYDAVALSNERSANYGNAELFGMEINHQWSKSLEFETSFQNYVNTYVSKDIAYFSLLRPMSELGIAKIFAQYPQYFQHATSCNTNWRILKEKPKERWCRTCPKCAFAFTILSPYIEKKALIDMFGGNLFEDASLLPLFRELLGLEGIKPFECVGTPEETSAALFLVHEAKTFESTPVMDLFVKDVLPTMKDPKKLVADTLKLSAEHAVPKEYAKLL